MLISDTIFCENQEEFDKIKRDIGIKFPNVVTVDSNDNIFPYKFTIFISNVSEKDYFFFLITFGVTSKSGTYVMMMNTSLHKIREYIDAYVNEHRR